MDKVLSFLADNYKWFMLAAVVLLFALIGFIVDGKKKKKNEGTVTMQENNAGVDPNMGATTVNPTPTVETPATPVVEQNPGIVLEEPTLNNVEATSTEVNLGVEENGSIFGTPEMQEPASVETPSEVVEEPTLIIEDKAMPEPQMTAPVSEVTVTPEVTPTVAPTMEAPTPEVAPAAPEVIPSTPVVEPAPVAPTPVVTTPEVTPTVAPATPVQQVQPTTIDSTTINQ